MYDIVKEIWKNPGAQYSPYPIWLWNGELDADKLVNQLDAFHKKGVDGVTIRPWRGMSAPEHLSEEYFEIMTAALEAAKKRRMAVVISDDFSQTIKEALDSEVSLRGRALFAQPAGGEIPEGGEILYRLYIKSEDGLLSDVRLSPAEGFSPYDFIFGMADGGEADLLNPSVTDKLVKLTLEKYYSALHGYFGSVIIGFYLTPEKKAESQACVGGIRWSCGMNDDWIESSGDFLSLASLMLEPKVKKVRREAEFIYNNVLRGRFNSSCLAAVSRWCREHGVGLVGGAAGGFGDIAYSGSFDVPASVVSCVGGRVSEECAAAVKYTSDMARHIGISHSAAELRVEFTPTPDEFMCVANSAVTYGASMLMPCAFNYSTEIKENTLPDMGQGTAWWSEYRRAAGYLKRMSWLNGTGTNNPCCAVLCSPEYVPVGAVRELYERGYTFNYLSLGDLMQKSHVHGGSIHIDRYEYDILLIDSRLRLSADIVTKIGKFVTSGGKMYRGNDFASFLDKHVRRGSYFAPDDASCRSIRFAHLTKSGCPFFAMINEGDEALEGRFVTDIGCAAEKFDPFTGKTEPIYASLADRGFEYEMCIPPHSACVIGLDPDSLVRLKKEDDKKYCLSELSAHSGSEFRFTVRKTTERVVLSAKEADGVVSVRINGAEAGKFVFKPYEIDITPYVSDGENTAVLTPEAALDDINAEICRGCAVKLYESSQI